MPDPQKVLISAPKDRSLEAYKAWINEMFAHITLGGKDSAEPTEEEWQANHKEFWEKADAAE